MQKAETKSRAGTAAPGQSPQMEVKAALSGFLSEFNAFQSEIKAKLQEQETRLAMLDRKSIAMNRPPLARGRRDRDAAQEGLRRLSALRRRRRAARPDRRGEGAVDRGGGGRRLSGRSADREPDRRRAALVGLDPDHRQRGDGRGERLRRAGRPHRHRRRLGDRDRRRRPRPARRRSTASRSRCTSCRRCRRRRSGCSTTAPSTSRAGWRSGSPTSSAAPRRTAFIAGDGIDKPTGFLQLSEGRQRPLRLGLARLRADRRGRRLLGDRSGRRDRRPRLFARRALPGQRRPS